MISGFWEKIEKPIMAIAPMSGVSDEPFRLMFLKHGKPSVFWTEFVSVDGLLSPKAKKYSLDILHFLPEEQPIVAQIFGGNPVNFEKAAKIIAELGFAGIDINMGCPNRDIEKNGGGAALIKNPVLAKEIIRATKKGAGEIPVSVKTRIGYSRNQINEWIPALLEENIAALTIHFRTRKETYATPAHWELAKEIVNLRNQYAPKTLLIGNGDVGSLSEAKRLIKETGFDGVMIGRRILGNPWFFSDKKPTISDKLNAIIEHVDFLENFYRADIEKDGFCKQFESIKKHLHAYAKGFKGAKELNERLMKTKSASEVRMIVKEVLDKQLG